MEAVEFVHPPSIVHHRNHTSVRVIPGKTHSSYQKYSRYLRKFFFLFQIDCRFLYAYLLEEVFSHFPIVGRKFVECTAHSNCMDHVLFFPAICKE